MRLSYSAIRISFLMLLWENFQTKCSSAQVEMRIQYGRQDLLAYRDVIVAPSGFYPDFIWIHLGYSHSWNCVKKPNKKRRWGRRKPRKILVIIDVFTRRIPSRKPAHSSHDIITPPGLITVRFISQYYLCMIV